MKAAQNRYKSYANQRRWPLEFEAGDHVFLQVSPTKGVYRFGVRVKLSPRYEKLNKFKLGIKDIIKG